jgi:hypothetical protein
LGTAQNHIVPINLKCIPKVTCSIDKPNREDSLQEPLKLMQLQVLIPNPCRVSNGCLSKW